MLQIRVIPCLLLDNGRLVKTVKFKNPSYVGDPCNAIKIYNEKEVDELIIVDIRATLDGKPPNFKLLSQVSSECFMPLCYGGGIRQTDEINKIFNLGIEKVAINSSAIENHSIISRAAELFGSQSIVFSMDVKKTFLGKYIVYSHCGRKVTKHDPLKLALIMEEMGAGEILLNSIDRDGTWEGYDIELIRKITDAVNIPVIASGGAGNINDFRTAVIDGGASAVAAGSMVVYSGKGLGVLIKFPKRDELIKILGEN